MKQSLRHALVVASAALLAWAGTAHAATVLLSDNGFELPDLGSTTGRVAAPTGTGWTFGSSTGIIANGVTYTLQGSSTMTGATNGNSDGTTSTLGQAAYLVNASSISTTFTLTSEALVSVNFGMEEGVNGNTIDVYLGPTASLTKVGSGLEPSSRTSFQTFNTTAIDMAAGTYTLKFTGTLGANAYVDFLDNIQINAQAVPEPGVLGLGIGAGLLMLVVRRRRAYQA